MKHIVKAREPHDPDFLEEERVRYLFNQCCGKFKSAYIVDPNDFWNAFAEAVRDSYATGWHQGWRDAPGDDW